jgi:hypothetical protein
MALGVTLALGVWTVGYPTVFAVADWPTPTSTAIAYTVGVLILGFGALWAVARDG